MSYQTGIADKLRSYGLNVVEVAGWQTRGSSYFNPRGVVMHHTAVGGAADMPTLNALINGRRSPYLPGPLCNVGLSRSGVVYVIAAGRANHAGTGGYNGMSGNSSVFGIEAENNGVGEPWGYAQLDAYWKVNAALLDVVGSTTKNLCGHKEWTSRKIDPAGINMNEARFNTGMNQLYHYVKLIKESGGGAPAPAPAPAPSGGVFNTYHKMIRRGSSNHGLVIHLQQLLNDNMLRDIKADGIFGPATEIVTKKFQHMNGLSADGIVGDKTWAKLHPVLKEGSKGWPVAEVQNEVGAKADLVFGPQTKEAVKVYQSKAGLTSDGIVGPNTYSVMLA